MKLKYFRYLGSRPVKLFKVRVQAAEAVLAVSSRTWLGYHYQNRFHLTPLSYECLEYAAGFSSGNFYYILSINRRICVDLLSGGAT